MAATPEPPLSIVTGTRNRPEWIERLVASVLEHTDGDFELLVGDASDRTPAYESRDTRVKVFREPEPLGYVRGYNALFRRARGRFVAFLNDDLEVRPGWWRATRRVFARHPRVDLACLPLVEPDDPGALVLLYDRIPYACMGVVRRTAGEALGWLDEGFHFYGADPDFALRLLLSGRRLAPVRGRLLFHHKLPDAERGANAGRFARDNERLARVWSGRTGTPRRCYRRTSLRYFRGFETRWSEPHATLALELRG